MPLKRTISRSQNLSVNLHAYEYYEVRLRHSSSIVLSMYLMLIHYVITAIYDVSYMLPSTPQNHTTNPHHKLKGKCHSLIDDVFATKGGDFILSSFLGKCGICKSHLKFTEKTFCEILDFLADDIYVKFGQRTFGQ